MIPFINLGSIQIPTFFLVISLSLTGLLFLLSKRVELYKKDRKLAFDIALLMMAAGFLGGRLMHVIYEEPAYYAEHPESILYFWQGGFTFYGGLIFCLLAGFIFVKLRKISFSEWADFFTPLFSLAHALGRLGCVLSGCCFGTYCNLPWSIQGRHPSALYLSIGEFAIFGVLLFFEKKTKAPGTLFAKWLMLHSLLRYVVEFWRDDFRGAFFHLPVLGMLSISQVISGVIFLIAGIYCLFKIEKIGPDKN